MDSRTETILFYGDSGVGKSSLIKRWLDHTFDPKLEAASPLKYSFKTLYQAGKRVHLKIFDISGERAFTELWVAYLRSSTAVVFLFDVRNRDSFNSVKVHFDTAKERDPTQKQYFLLGNQCDHRQRAVTEAEARAFAHEFGLTYIETSANTGHGIALFQEELLKLSRPIVVENATPKPPAHLDLFMRIHAFQGEWKNNDWIEYICNSILKPGTQNINPQFYFTAKLPELGANLRYLVWTWRSVLNSILNVAMTVAFAGSLVGVPLLAGFVCSNLAVALAGLLLFGSLLQTNKKMSGHSCMFFAFGEKQATQTMCHEVFTQLDVSVRL